VVYCNMHNPGDSSSESAADFLQDAGLNVRALKGGYPVWDSLGYPTEKDPTVTDA
jgi:rhodanese-related sulfurtransferase